MRIIAFLSVYVCIFDNVVFLHLFRRRALLLALQGAAKTIKRKVVCGADKANTIFHDFYASPTGAHCGQTQTREAISEVLLVRDDSTYQQVGK